MEHHSKQGYKNRSPLEKKEKPINKDKSCSMKIFRNKSKSQKKLNPFLERMLLRCKYKLQKFASWLQQKTIQYSPKKLTILLAVFCFVFLTESLLVIYHSVGQKNSNSYFITPIRPMILLREKKYQPLISEKEYNTIHSFKIHLDSLKNTASGKSVLDSLFTSSPHLIDSINLLENLYYEQQSNQK